MGLRGVQAPPAVLWFSVGQLSPTSVFLRWLQISPDVFSAVIQPPALFCTLLLFPCASAVHAFTHATDITADLEAALEQFATIAEDLKK
jgi:hypothetical protein